MHRTWKEYPLCTTNDVNLDVCLDKGGQSFTWIRVNNDEWVNFLEGYIIALHRKEDKVVFSTNATDHEKAKSIIEDYLRLTDDLPSYYEEWKQDAHFREMAKGYPGIRLLRQDPVETLFAFICSQNNAIPRITKMVQHLRTNYGEYVGEYAGHQMHKFPSINKLAVDGVEADLRKAGFGYRAKYINQAARFLIDNQVDLFQLRQSPYAEVHERLVEIPGVGPKVADCIALMSLDQLGAVPVDTHIWKVACKHYRFPGIPKEKSSMNKTVYRSIGEHFRKIFGPKAGWAHLVLFAAQQRLK